MKQKTKLAMAGLFFASSATAIAAPMNGWYAGLMLGATFNPTISYTLFNPTYNAFAYLTTPQVASHINYRKGIDGGAQLGYRYCNFRMEAEFLYAHNQWKSWTVGPYVFNKKESPQYPKLNAYTQFGAGLFNVYYEVFDPESDPVFAPYLGLGLGYGHGENKIKLERATWTTAPEKKYTQRAPLGQVIFGLAYYQTNNLSYGLDYRFMTTNKIRNFGARIISNSINLSFNYTFCDSY